MGFVGERLGLSGSVWGASGNVLERLNTVWNIRLRLERFGSAWGAFGKLGRLGRLGKHNAICMYGMVCMYGKHNGMK